MSFAFLSDFEFYVRASIVYYFIVNTCYMLLMLASLVALHRYSRVKPLLNALKNSFPVFAPSISVLAPAFNEQETIVESIKSFLLLDYPDHEVVVINDGSNDETLSRLVNAFELIPDSSADPTSFLKHRVRQIYKSRIHAKLRVIDKHNSGKAGALNVGLAYCKHEVYCAVDSDSLLETDALIKVAIPFVENPGKTIASGGTVRIANGADVTSGTIQDLQLPKNPLVLLQIIEYTRAFLCGRIGWNAIDSTLVISGAFGLFSKKAVMEIGGYADESVGEDMELVLRLHRYHRHFKKPYSIVFVPDPVCWTEAPSNWSSLARQRDRWQRGLADSLMRNRGMIFNPKFGMLGLVALPFYLFVELLGPIFEIASLIVVGYATYMHRVNMELLGLFLIASLLYGAILSVAAIMIEEVFFFKYKKVSQFLSLFAICLIESLGYRQMTSLWRIHGMWKFMKGDHSWGQLSRKGFNTGNSPRKRNAA